MRRFRPRDASGNTAALISWAMYDWANSAFAAIISTFVFAAYFTRQIAPNETEGASQWGFTLGLVGIAVALSGPLVGAIADQTGRLKRWLAFFTLLCVVATALLWYIKPEPGTTWPALFLVALATLGAELASIFYNAMLPTLARPERVGRWSGWAWGLGYAGGLAALSLALVAFVRPDSWFELDRASAAHVRATFLLTAAWYLVFALPLFLVTPDMPATHKRYRQALSDGFAQMRDSVRQARRYAHVLRFFIARMVFIDGLTTVFVFGGVYAAGTFGMNEEDVLLFGIGLNITAGVGAVAFAWIDDWLGSKRTILWALGGLILSTGAILMVQSTYLFWTLGLILGIFVGPVQAASRSYLARTAPASIRNQMFGLFALSGKATAFAGPLLVGWVTYLSGSQRIGMSVILGFFIVGFVMMLTVPAADRDMSGK